MLATMLGSSQLLSSVQSLSELSGEWFFYEPRQEIVSSSDYCSPIEWRQPSPNEAESLGLGELSSYSLELCRELGSSVTKLSTEEAVELLCERKLWQRCSLLWLPSYCTGGDYCGSTHHIANARYLLSRFSSPELRECGGGYGSQGVIIDPRYLSEELLELLQSLENYPVLCEDELSSYELELQEETWQHTVRRDWENALGSALSELLSDNEELASSIVESLSEDALFSLFSHCAELSNTYWEAESGTTVYIDIDRIAQSLSSELLLELLQESLSSQFSQALQPLLASSQLSLELAG
jgi:hypothetical protein